MNHPDFLPLVRLFKILDDIDRAGLLDEAIEEIGRRLRDEASDAKWAANQADSPILSLANKVARKTGVDSAVCFSAAVAAMRPSAAKIALQAVKDFAAHHRIGACA